MKLLVAMALEIGLENVSVLGRRSSLHVSAS
jgi:hypothetical protein